MPCHPPQVSSVDSGCSTQGSVDSGSASAVEDLCGSVASTPSQAADIKGKLARLGELIEGNTTSIQDYSKSLAVVLQKDLAKLFDTIQQWDSPCAPPMSQAMMSALLTIAQEAVKVYETPYTSQN